SFLPSDILAAFLYAQLEAHEEIQAKRKRAWNFYHCQLWSWAQRNEIQLPVVPPHTEQSYHMFYMLVPRPDDRDALIAYLKTRNILSVFHYVPLHLSEMGRSLDGRTNICAVTEDVSGRLVRLPFFNDITEQDQARVVDALFDFYRTRSTHPTVAFSVL